MNMTPIPEVTVFREEGTVPETWRVERINGDWDGGVEVNTFSGLEAKGRAMRFAIAEYGYIPD